jgi:hypothetical protein
MKKMLTAVAVLAAALPGLALAQNRGPDVGVSVQISQPGVYGRIDIGRFPQPQVVVAQPVIIQRPVYVQQAQVQPQIYRAPDPIYMWVPPGHRKNWRKHCGQYNACGVPVYFVRDDWYDRKVRDHGHDHDHDDGPGKGRGRGHDKRD